MSGKKRQGNTKESLVTRVMNKVKDKIQEVRANRDDRENTTWYGDDYRNAKRRQGIE